MTPGINRGVKKLYIKKISIAQNAIIGKKPGLNIKNTGIKIKKRSVFERDMLAFQGMAIGKTPNIVPLSAIEKKLDKNTEVYKNQEFEKFMKMTVGNRLLTFNNINKVDPANSTEKADAIDLSAEMSIVGEKTTSQNTKVEGKKWHETQKLDVFVDKEAKDIIDHNPAYFKKFVKNETALKVLENMAKNFKLKVIVDLCDNKVYIVASEKNKAILTENSPKDVLIRAMGYQMNEGADFIF